MSGGSIHVHGPHGPAVEHRSRHGDGVPTRIAVKTAILANVGALFAHTAAGSTRNEALLHENDAAIRKTEAFDPWTFCQAKRGKQNLAEPGAALLPCEPAERRKREAARYDAEKADIRRVAEKPEAEGKAASALSDAGCTCAIAGRKRRR